MAYISVQKIRFDDVDGAGIVYYPHFFHLCHKAFEDMFDDEGPYNYPEMITKRRIGFPTVAIESDFKAPLLYGDMAEVKIRIVRLGTTSVQTRYDIMRMKDETICFTGYITTALMDLDKRKSVPITGELRAFLEKHFEQDDTQ